MSVARAETYTEVLSFDTRCVVEDVIIKVRGDKDIVNTYSIPDCSKWKTDGWEFWKCKCNGQEEFKFNILNVSAEISYDVVAQIYIAPLVEVTDKPEGQVAPSPIELDNMNKRRTFTYSDIQPTPSKSKPIEKENFVWKVPEFDIPSVSIIIFSVFVLTVGLIIFIVFWIRKELKDDVPKMNKKPGPPPGFKKLKEDEVNDYVGKYI